MNDKQIIELYRSLLAATNKGKGMLYAQIKVLTGEVYMFRQSMGKSKQAIDYFCLKYKKLEEKNNRIANLEQILSDALLQAKLDRKKRIVRSSE